VNLLRSFPAPAGFEVLQLSLKRLLVWTRAGGKSFGKPSGWFQPSCVKSATCGLASARPRIRLLAHWRLVRGDWPCARRVPMAKSLATA